MERLWYLPTAIVLAGVVLGPLGVQLGLFSSELGWGLFFFGLVFALLALPVTAGAAAYASATGRSWRGWALRGAIVPLVVVVILILPNGRKLEPLIHDITTDSEDTLVFPPEVTQTPEQLRRETLPREQVLELARQAYPEVEPLELQLDPERAFELAVATAEDMDGWRVVERDPSAGILRAEATSRVFRFVDDIVIRVQPVEGSSGSRIDMRSRSRVGQSDLGANAARIESYLAALRDRAEAASS